jgi:hypothetical protein
LRHLPPGGLQTIVRRRHGRAIPATGRHWCHTGRGQYDTGETLNLLSPLIAIALAGCSVVGIRSGTEEPAYKLITVTNGLQIRQYAPRLAASVTVQGDEIAARSQGFRKIASFIFGANVSKSSIAMTAPVAQQSDPAKIAMTAPVAQNQTATGGWTITFFMPAKYTEATLPKPTDPSIEIVQVPSQTYAVYQYSGIPGRDATEAAHAALMGKIQATNYAATGEITDWFYDPPWTIPFLRRNEAAVPVAPK